MDADADKSLETVKSFFQILVKSSDIAREIFYPGIELIKTPTPMQTLLMNYGLRTRSLLASMAKLDDPKDFNLIIGGVRTLFEMAVDVQLIAYKDKLPTPFSEDEILERQDIVEDRLMIKMIYVLGNDPHDVANQAERKKRVEEMEVRLNPRQVKVFEKLDRNLDHWTGVPLKDRVDWLEKSGKAECFFGQWYQSHWRFSSQFVHGGLTPFNMNPHDVKNLPLSYGVFFPWLVTFLGRELFVPVWRLLGLDNIAKDNFVLLLLWSNAIILNVHPLIKKLSEETD